MKMTTLKDIADQLGVSQSLVSKVLNGRMGTTKARPDLIEAIQHTADKLGYMPNLTAKALVQGRQGVIGVFLRLIGQPGSDQNEVLAEGILDQSRKYNQRLLMNFCSEDEELRLLCSLVGKSIVDGLIIGGFIRESILPELLKVRRAGTPIVTAVTSHTPVAPMLPNIGIDQREVGRLATLHLIERGCRRIAHLNSMAERFQGYCTALSERSLPLLDELVWPSRYNLTYDAGAQAVAHWLAEGARFDGIVAQSDEQAAGALNALVDRGIRVPDDVRIIGVDNAPYCNYSIVPLSSVSHNLQIVGRQAVEMLMKLIECPDRELASVCIQPALHARRSSI